MISQNVAELIKNHVVLEVECMDRMYLKVMYQRFRQKVTSFTSCVNNWDPASLFDRVALPTQIAEHVFHAQV